MTCTYCGSATEVEYSSLTQMMQVWCTNCGAAGPFAPTHDKAIEAWATLTAKELRVLFLTLGRLRELGIDRQKQVVDVENEELRRLEELSTLAYIWEALK